MPPRRLNDCTHGKGVWEYWLFIASLSPDSVTRGGRYHIKQVTHVKPTQFLNLILLHGFAKKLELWEVDCFDVRGPIGVEKLEKEFKSKCLSSRCVTSANVMRSWGARTQDEGISRFVWTLKRTPSLDINVTSKFSVFLANYMCRSGLCSFSGQDGQTFWWCLGPRGVIHKLHSWRCSADMRASIRRLRAKDQARGESQTSTYVAKAGLIDLSRMAHNTLVNRWKVHVLSSLYQKISFRCRMLRRVRRGRSPTSRIQTFLKTCKWLSHCTQQ